MTLFACGVNHQSAPVSMRERIVFGPDELPRALSELHDCEGVKEAAILSTCNRTDLYLGLLAGGDAAVRDWFQGYHGLSDRDLARHMYIHEADRAVRHVMRVASGLDSMVLGEPQILGQLKDAFRHAQQANTLGRKLGLLMQHTFGVAKKIRTDTEIGASPVSVASAAVNLANQFFAGFTRHTALLVGAGVTIELVAKHLTKKKVGRLFVANRSVERAQELAGKLGGFALPLSEIEGTLPEADILITSTAATEPVITFEQMEAAVKARKRKPIFAVDIAVPRDIEPSAGDLSDVYLYSIDDLDKVIQEGQGSREAAAVEASRLLDDEIRRYANIERSKEVVPVIAALREQSQTVCDDVSAQARRRIARGESADDAIAFATASLMKKLLHKPSVTLRRAGEASDHELIDAARKLFGLDRD